MKYFSKFLLWIMGWKVMDLPAPDPKCIILGVPHTSAWDFFISFLFYNSMGRTAYVMVKKGFFWGPFAPILRAMGGIPVNQGKGATVAKQMIDEFGKRDIMHLAIAPEGTGGRKRRKV